MTVWNRPRGEILQGRDGQGLPQHSLRRENNQRFSPFPHRLSPQHVEVLRRGARAGKFGVVARRKLKEAFHARAGMFRPLPLIAVRKQHDQSGKQAPLFFARGDELIDQHLRAVGEIAELRLPQSKRFGIVAAIAIFEAQHRGFRKRRIEDFEQGLGKRHIRERRIGVLRFQCQSASHGVD